MAVALHMFICLCAAIASNCTRDKAGVHLNAGFLQKLGPENSVHPADRKLKKGDAKVTNKCRGDEQKNVASERSRIDVLSGNFADTAYLGAEDRHNFAKEFDNRTVSQAKGNASNPGNIHLWGGMQDREYKTMVKGILDKAKVAQGGVVVESGAGMGKLVAIAIYDYNLIGIGFEPSLHSVCAGNKVFADIFERNEQNGLHKGEANDVSRVTEGTADLALTLGVTCYFPDITYLCQVLSEQLRVLKPGGIVMHAWVLDAPKTKGDDKLNIKKEFWGNTSTGPLPACASAIHQQVDVATLEIKQGCPWCGPGNGYGVFMRKKTGA